MLSADLRNTGEGFDLQLVHRDAAIDHHHQTLLIQLLVVDSIAVTWHRVHFNTVGFVLHQSEAKG